jgi:hypothetical protein
LQRPDSGRTADCGVDWAFAMVRRVRVALTIAMEMGRWPDQPAA